jgi:hypothetical protein
MGPRPRACTLTQTLSNAGLSTSKTVGHLLRGHFSSICGRCGGLPLRMTRFATAASTYTQGEHRIAIQVKAL